MTLNITSQKVNMLYELNAILQSLKRVDKKLQRNAYKEGEIQEEINKISDFPELLNNLQEYVTYLQHTDKNDVNTTQKILSNIDTKLELCSCHIRLTKEAIRQFLMQFSDDEIDEILT